jgi:hypothetical protein
VRDFSETNVPVGGNSFAHHHATGFGVALNANLEPINDWHLIFNGFWNNGGGRCIGGLGPDVVVPPMHYLDKPLLRAKQGVNFGRRSGVEIESLLTSYVERQLWLIANGAPKTADTFLSFRYILP